MTIEDDYTNFDTVLELVGNNGYFQKRFNIIFNFLLAIAVMMPNFNIVLALSIPNHWCYVPGIQDTNFSKEEWMSLTIPRENSYDDENVFSKCKMYKVPTNRVDMFEENRTQLDIVGCQYGWEYDKTWYETTATTQENWVCDRSLYVTNSLVSAKIGDVFGTFVFGQLGDKFGRRPVFFLTVGILLIGRVLAIFSAGYIWIFLFAVFFGNLATPSVYQSPLIIAMEISRNEDRAYITMLQTIGGTCGLCLLPILMWIIRDWTPFMLATSVPCLMFLCCPTYIVESPRWLASRGNTKDTIKELSKIGKANKKHMPEEIAIFLHKAKVNKQTVHGYISLFSNWRLAKNTLLLVCVWITAALIYYTLMVNVTNLEGNPFLNYFWQALAELPGFVLGKYACDKIGRRWAHVGGFIGVTAACVPLVFIINDTNLVTISSALVTFIKFCTCISFYGINIHSIEIYPTCIRQTGLSLGLISASAFSALGPYIVYLGTSFNQIYPYVIIACVSTVGAVCGAHLPETLNQKLPETFEDSMHFGADQMLCGSSKECREEESVELK